MVELTLLPGEILLEIVSNLSLDSLLCLAKTFNKRLFNICREQPSFELFKKQKQDAKRMREIFPEFGPISYSGIHRDYLKLYQLHIDPSFEQPEIPPSLKSRTGYMAFDGTFSWLPADQIICTGYTSCHICKNDYQDVNRRTKLLTRSAERYEAQLASFGIETPKAFRTLIHRPDLVHRLIGSCLSCMLRRRTQRHSPLRSVPGGAVFDRTRNIYRIAPGALAGSARGGYLLGFARAGWGGRTDGRHHYFLFVELGSGAAGVVVTQRDLSFRGPRDADSVILRLERLFIAEQYGDRFEAEEAVDEYGVSIADMEPGDVFTVGAGLEQYFARSLFDTEVLNAAARGTRPYDRLLRHVVYGLTGLDSFVPGQGLRCDREPQNVMQSP